MLSTAVMFESMYILLSSSATTIIAFSDVNIASYIELKTSLCLLAPIVKFIIYAFVPGKLVFTAPSKNNLKLVSLVGKPPKKHLQ